MNVQEIVIKIPITEVKINVFIAKTGQEVETAINNSGLLNSKEFDLVHCNILHFEGLAEGMVVYVEKGRLLQTK